jgi:hypothetical protein
MNVEFLDIAERELDDAFKYYDGIYKGLGLRFIAELESSIERIKLHPDAWQKPAQLRTSAYLTDSHIQLFIKLKATCYWSLLLPLATKDLTTGLIERVARTKTKTQ